MMLGAVAESMKSLLPSILKWRLCSVPAQRAAGRLRVRVRLSSFDLICHMVESGIGIAVVPEAAARRWQRAMSLRMVPITDAWAVWHLTICFRSLKSLTPHARSLVEFLRPRT